MGRGGEPCERRVGCDRRENTSQGTSPARVTDLALVACPHPEDGVPPRRRAGSQSRMSPADASTTTTHSRLTVKRSNKQNRLIGRFVIALDGTISSTAAPDVFEVGPC